MKKNQNSGKFFGFLGDTLSISNLFTGSRKSGTEKTVTETNTGANQEKSTAEYFNFLADTLSRFTVYA